MRRTLVTIISLVVLSLLSTAASAAELKVGVVDVEYVILKSKQGKSAKTKLKKLFDKKQKQLDGAQTKLLEIKKKIENPSDMMTDKQKKELLMGYQGGLMKLQELYLKNQQELAKEELELMKPILKTLESVLTDMATNDGYDLIMNRSQHGVLFSSPKHDLTKTVIEKMDKKA